MASAKQIGKLISVMAAALPSFRLPSGPEGDARLAEMIRAYHMLLGDLDADLLTKAALHVVSTQTFFPSAGELRGAYFSLAEQAIGVPTAPEAWGELKRLFRRGFSRYRVPTLEDVSHPRIYESLQAIGGWRMLCESDNDAADRARFVQAYETYTEREREVGRMLPEVRAAVKEIGSGGFKHISAVMARLTEGKGE